MKPFEIKILSNVSFWGRLKIAWIYLFTSRMDLICTIVDEETK